MLNNKMLVKLGLSVLLGSSFSTPVNAEIITKECTSGYLWNNHYAETSEEKIELVPCKIEVITTSDGSKEVYSIETLTDIYTLGEKGYVKSTDPELRGCLKSDTFEGDLQTIHIICPGE